jgi:ATP-binding cassette, subfamily B, bacterial
MKRVVKGHRIPFIPQTDEVDCGPACVAMVLRFHGRDVPIDEIRRRCRLTGAGTNARVLLQVARELGLRGDGFAVQADAIKMVPPASIVHFGEARRPGGHFAVFDSSDRTGVHVVDPLDGRIALPSDVFRQIFSGYVLCFNLRESEDE